MVEYALVGLLPKEVGLKVLAVNGFIEWPVVNLNINLQLFLIIFS